MIDALNAKVQATQIALQKQNEVLSAKAEADKAVEAARGEAESTLIKARAQAEANRLLANSLTPNLIQQQWINKWDGKLPSVSGSATSGMLVDVRGK